MRRTVHRITPALTLAQKDTGCDIFAVNAIAAAPRRTQRAALWKCFARLAAADIRVVVEYGAVEPDLGKKEGMAIRIAKNAMIGMFKRNPC